MKITSRSLFGALGLICLLLIGTALFLQHVKQMEPCPMCVLQRYAYLLIAFIGIGAFLHHPGPRGQGIYAALLALAALAGGAVAGRQVWLIHHPVMSCGPGLEELLDQFPLTHALPWLFKGTADCATDVPELFAVPVPLWSLLSLTAMTAAALWLLWRALRRSG